MASYLPSRVLDALLNIPNILVGVRDYLLPIPPAEPPQVRNVAEKSMGQVANADVHSSQLRSLPQSQLMTVKSITPSASVTASSTSEGPSNRDTPASRRVDERNEHDRGSPSETGSEADTESSLGDDNSEHQPETRKKSSPVLLTKSHTNYTNSRLRIRGFMYYVVRYSVSDTPGLRVCSARSL